MTRPAISALRDAVVLAISREGLRPLAARSGVPVGVLRSARAGHNLTADSISRLADALGMVFHVGYPDAPAAGLAEEAGHYELAPPGGDGLRVAPDGMPSAGCVWLRDDDADLGLPDRGAWLRVDLDAAPAIGCRAMLRDASGRVALGAYHGREGDWIVLAIDGPTPRTERLAAARVSALSAVTAISAPGCRRSAGAPAHASPGAILRDARYGLIQDHARAIADMIADMGNDRADDDDPV